VQSSRQESTDDQADLSSAPAHDRRHDDAQFVADASADLGYALVDVADFLAKLDLITIKEPTPNQNFSLRK
jgi:hypothetical protein